MADRKIHIADARKRDAEINFKGYTPKKDIIYVDKNKEIVQSKKYIKSTALETFDELVKKYDDAEGVAQAIMDDDPEINLEMTGRFMQQSSRVYANSDHKIVFNVNRTEVIYDPKGEIIEEREEPKVLESNILGEKPINWSGKYFKKEDIYNKFVFIRKYQLKHTNGLTYDMMYAMAKDLHDQNSMMLVGSGKGTGPLVFQDGGKPFRGFLEGRVKGEQYLLILHLSNMELKPLEIE